MRSPELKLGICQWAISMASCSPSRLEQLDIDLSTDLSHSLGGNYLLNSTASLYLINKAVGILIYVKQLVHRTRVILMDLLPR